MDTKEFKDQKEYAQALKWLERSIYDVKSTIVGKYVRVDLVQRPKTKEDKERVIKSETIVYSTHVVPYIHKKIIALFYHFNK